MKALSRRQFLGRSLGAGAAVLGAAAGRVPLPGAEGAGRMRFGLVTYLWGRDWDLPTLLRNCEKTGFRGVELRTTHAHGVEPSLSAAQRREVKKRFEDSPVEHVGLGSNENFDSPDPARLKRSIEATKAFVLLSHDTAGSGVKVKPNSFHKGVDPEKTIEQIGRSLNQVGRFAAEHGQEIRLEVHGQCCRLPTIKKIMDVADHPSVGVCWNSNGQDLEGEGLEHNFHLVQKRFGKTAHVRELDDGGYPYQKLIDLFVGMGWKGWMLLEARRSPADRIAALREQRKLWETMVARASRRAG